MNLIKVSCQRLDVQDTLDGSILMTRCTLDINWLTETLGIS